MKVYLVTGLLTILAFEFCVSDDCSKYQVRKLHYRTTADKVVYRISITKTDGVDSVTLKADNAVDAEVSISPKKKYSITKSSNGIGTESEYIITRKEKKGHEHEEKRSARRGGMKGGKPKGKKGKKVKKVKKGGKDRKEDKYFRFNLNFESASLTKPELKELEYGSFQCTVIPTPCRILKKRCCTRVSPEGNIQARLPRYSDAGITIGFDNKVKIIALPEGYEKTSQDCDQIFHITKITSTATTEKRVREFVEFEEIDKANTIASIKYVSFKGGECNGGCGVEQSCPATTPATPPPSTTTTTTTTPATPPPSTTTTTTAPPPPPTTTTTTAIPPPPQTTTTAPVRDVEDDEFFDDEDLDDNLF